MWGQLIKDSVVKPREAARQVLALGVGPRELIQAAVVVTCLGILLGYLATRVAPGDIDVVSAAVLTDPLLGAAASLGVMALIVALTVRVGQAFGGTGTLWDALALVVWLNVMMVIIQTVQLLALVVLPPLAALLAIATLFWAVWAFANFVTELHGFQNPMLVLGASILTMVVVLFGLAMLFAILGITPQGAG